MTGMRKFEFESALRRDIPRTLLLAIMERFPVAARQALDGIRASYAGPETIRLDPPSERRAVGMVRHELISQTWKEIFALHGGENVASVPVEIGPDEIKQSPLYLATAGFGGTLVGFASQLHPDDLPAKSATRKALCHQNRGLHPDFFHPPEQFTDRQRAVLILVRRDRTDIGEIASLTLALIDSRYENFIYTWSLEDFIAGYGATSAGTEEGKATTKPILKPRAEGFKASRRDDKRDDGTSSGRK